MTLDMNTKFEKLMLWGALSFFILSLAILVPLTFFKGHFFWQLWVVLIFVILSFLFTFVYIDKTQQRLKIFQQHIHVHNHVLDAVSGIHEVAVFDPKGNTYYGTHPLLYPTKREFIRKVLSRLRHTDESNDLIYLMETYQRSSCMLEGEGNGLSLKTKRWLAHVCPVPFQHEDDQNPFMVVTLTNLSNQLEGASKLQQQLKQLETFIDQAPFGLCYVNGSGQIVGVNQTLAAWINIDKEIILGTLASTLFSPPLTDASGVLTSTIRYHHHTPFKVVVTVDQSLQNEGIQAYVFIRFDSSITFRSTVQRSSDSDMDKVFDDAAIPAVILDSNLNIRKFNTAFASLVNDIDQDERSKFTDFLEDQHKEEIIKKINMARQSLNGSLPFDVYLQKSQHHSTAFIKVIKNHPHDNAMHCSLLIQFIDTSEQKRLEQQFIQSQKMQAVGQLAGGIAHDFNNLLTAMIGFCDLLLQRYMPNDPSYMDIIQIKQNANRAANLVRQLLAFSRQQNLQPKIINVTDCLAELSALLRRLIGARLELIMNHGRDIWPVRVDVSQLEQVIINLAVNARDAMDALPNGTLIIQTRNYQNTISTQIDHDAMPVGDYVLIEVIDSGHGIPSNIMEHIFEPFFSTKEVGAGTGLGLSTVFGIVKQTGGFVGVESQVDKGTTFKIFLPRHIGEETHYNTTPEAMVTDLTGSETILLVEDEDAVRLFSARALRDKGYRVLEAENGDKALSLIDEGEVFDLVITDVVMPRMDGPTLCQKIREKNLDLKTIFISGYTEDTFRKNLGHSTNIHFLQKPFTLKDLAQKVKDVLSNDS